MTEQNEHLSALTEIRDLMNRSSRFLSLSGISGICAGVLALAGAGVAWFWMRDLFFKFPLFVDADYLIPGNFFSAPAVDFYTFFVLDAGSVLLLSLLCGWFFSRRKAKKQNMPFWDQTAWRALLNLFIPLAAGGLFCLALMLHGVIGLIAPATLIFYGLALLNASKYTLNDVRYLGVSQIALGLAACMFVGYGLFFWALGFGVLHIVYGAVMWWKYERGAGGE
ncbi:MAG: hypothetical protein FD123_2306 [Bacteroidetes bacterium]|nr:MAG: hypothetical protein FD123_2306 [Bacteroidota bacterium]